MANKIRNISKIRKAIKFYCNGKSATNCNPTHYFIRAIKKAPEGARV